MTSLLIWFVTLVPLTTGNYEISSAHLMEGTPMPNHETCMDYQEMFNEAAKLEPVIQNEDGSISVIVAECYTDI